MKRASFSFLSRLTCHKPRSFPLSSTRNYNFYPSSSFFPLHSPTHLNPYTRNQSLLLERQYQSNPSRSIDTRVEKQPQISSRQWKIKEKSKLEEAFEETLKAFKNIESSFNESELGLSALKVGLKLDQEGEDPERSISCASRALKALDKDDSKPSLLMP